MAGLTYVTGTGYPPAEFIVRPPLSALGSSNEPDPSNPMDMYFQNLLLNFPMCQSVSRPFTSLLCFCSRLTD